MPSSCNMLILAVNNFSHSGVRRFTSNSSVQLAMAWCFTAIKVQAAGCWFSKQKKVSTLPNYSHQSQILSCLGDQNQVSSVGDQASEELRAIESGDDKKWEMVKKICQRWGPLGGNSYSRRISFGLPTSRICCTPILRFQKWMNLLQVIDFVLWWCAFMVLL